MTARALARAASWWVGELSTLLPRPFREAIELRTRRLVVEFDGETARLQLSDRRGLRPLTEVALAGGAALPGDALEAIRRAGEGRLSELVVRVAPSKALRRTLTLPLAAERNVNAVLGFEMDRYTPFTADAVYYDHALVRRDREGRTLEVALTVVPRREIDPLLAVLDGWGLHATALEVAGEPAQGNLLPTARRGARRSSAGWPVRALAALAALLLAAVIAVPFLHKARTVNRLEAEIAALRPDALRAQALREELARRAAEERSLLERRARRPAAIDVLRELSVLLPEGTWLSQLELSGSRVKLRGESASASALVTVIENSAMFQNVAFEGSVTRDPGSQGERFAISAAAEPPARP